MKLKLGKHKHRHELEVVEVYDKKGRHVATIEPGQDGHSFAIVSPYMDKVGLENGVNPAVVVQLVDPDAPPKASS